VTLGNDNGTDGQTDRQTDRRTDRVRRNMRPPPREEGRIISKPKRTRDSRVCDCVLKWQRSRLMKLKHPLLQLN